MKHTQIIFSWIYLHKRTDKYYGNKKIINNTHHFYEKDVLVIIGFNIQFRKRITVFVKLQCYINILCCPLITLFR